MSAAAEASTPLHGLREFVKNHLTLVNAVVAAAVTMVGVLDFLAPALSVLPRVIYSCTAVLVVAMLGAALAPVVTGRLLRWAGFGARRDGVLLWRRAGWQFAVAILAATTVLGFVSMAKASQGGVLASQVPAVRSLQDSLLDIHRDMATLQTGVDDANRTLTRIAGSVDPDRAADRCADLGCAVEAGASADAVRRLFAKGARVPGDPIHDGDLLWQAIASGAPDRLAVFDQLVQHGIDRDMLILPMASSKLQVSTPGLATAREIADTARLDERWAHPARLDKFLPRHDFSLTGNAAADRWNDAIGCLKRSAGGVTPMELAALLQDGELWAHLAAAGDRLPQRELACHWQMPHRAGDAWVRIDRTTGQVRVAAQP